MDTKSYIVCYRFEKPDELDKLTWQYLEESGEGILENVYNDLGDTLKKINGEHISTSVYLFKNTQYKNSKKVLEHIRNNAPCTTTTENKKKS